MPKHSMVAEPPAASPPSARASMTTGDKVRLVLRGIGQTLITLGLVVLLFVVYEVWITNLFARAENDRIAHKLEQQFAKGDDPILTLPGGGDSTIPIGTGIANIYLPRLGSDYHWTIVEGDDQESLAKGPGHYPQTALPGQRGNFGVAGHRVGKGEPFLNLDKLKSGDAVIIETESDWYVYRVLGSPVGKDPQNLTVQVKDTAGGTHTVPGREIVDPSAGRVLLPIPNDTNSADKPAEALMTMTTCHPKFTAAQRMIVHAKLTGTVAPLMQDGKRVEKMPPAIRELYSEVKS
ncbi:MAG: class E sortase [Jatrophihabitans sp.]